MWSRPFRSREKGPQPSSSSVPPTYRREDGVKEPRPSPPLASPRSASLPARHCGKAEKWPAGRGEGGGKKMAAQGRERVGGGKEERGSGRPDSELLLHPELLSEEFLLLTLEQVSPGTDPARGGRDVGPSSLSCLLSSLEPPRLFLRVTPRGRSCLPPLPTGEVFSRSSRPCQALMSAQESVQEKKTNKKLTKHRSILHRCLFRGGP